MGGQVPAKGWQALQPENGFIVKGKTFDGLLLAVRSYRTANGLPLENNLRRQVENQVCLALPPGEAARRCYFLKEDDTENPPERRKWRSGKEQLKNFALAAKVVMERAASGETIHVSQEEANRRAQVCSQCRDYNVPAVNCWGCGQLGDLYRSISGRLSTPYDGRLESCDVCGCSNKTQVHIAGPILRQIAEEQGNMVADSFPDWCWKKKALENG